MTRRWTLFSFLVMVLGIGLWVCAGGCAAAGGGGEDEEPAVCEPPCEADEVCEDGVCVPAVVECDPPCAADEVCEDGVCVPAVVECDPPCEADEVCEDGVCVPAVVECDPPCEADEVCEDGVCVPAVVECDPPCEADEVCEDGVCVPEEEPPDGAALFGTNCAGCHGDDGTGGTESIRNRTAAELSAGLASATHDTPALNELTEDDVAAIADFLATDE